jgi:protein SCO1/2
VGTIAGRHTEASRAGLRSSARVVALVAVGAAVVGVTVGVVLHLSLGQGTSTASHAATELEGQAIWRAGRVAAPNFRLRDQSGRLVSLAAQRNRTVVLAFMDSRCHQVCPLEGRVIGRAVAGLPRGTRPTVLVVSVDPWADTPASARAAAAHWAFTGRWHWLLGTRRQLAKVWRSYRIYVKWTAGDIIHSDAVYVIDRRGYERVGLLFPFLPSPLERDLAKLARETGA